MGDVLYEWVFKVTDGDFRNVTWEASRLSRPPKYPQALVQNFERRSFESEVVILSYGRNLAEALAAAKDAYVRDIPDDTKASLWSGRQ